MFSSFLYSIFKCHQQGETVMTDNQYTIVYNRLNHEAVLAAAILVSQLQDARAVDISQRIEDTSMEYVWVGVEPIPGVGSFHENVTNKNHIVIINGSPEINAVTKVKKAYMLLGSYVKEEEHLAEESDCDLGLRRTLIHRVCEYFNIESDTFESLAYHAAKFHDKTTSLKDLVFVYKNIMAAEECLLTGKVFQVQYAEPGDVQEYLQAAERTKKGFGQSYQEIVVQDGDMVRSVLYTTMSDSRYHLALRLIKLSHKNFLNMSLGLSGSIAYSNMRQLRFDKNQDQPILLN
jgi:hypothetical protein